MIQAYNKKRWENFKQYYKLMRYSWDCDPAYPALRYICDRYELNMEQRYWIAFLYGCTYCVPTTFYIYNEFPDFENVSIDRMQKWWKENKKRVFFQSDRAKMKNFDKFIPCVQSYMELIKPCDNSQQQLFFSLEQDLEKLYDITYEKAAKIYYFGRFSLFNYLEALNELTDLKMRPSMIKLIDAESSRNGLCYACGEDDMVTIHHEQSVKPIDYKYLALAMCDLLKELQQENPELNVNIWNVETVLCAYKKLYWSTRYFGYYIDRMQEEITLAEEFIPNGVDWSVLWDFRREFLHHSMLGELNNWRGVRHDKMTIFKNTQKFVSVFETVPDFGNFKKSVTFEKIGDVYEHDL
ncbi:MAG: hypothetical protein WC444_06590 [Candidatus Paceibacterota bacterium]